MNAETQCRVLLVEDVDAMRLYLRLLLENHGCEVFEAANLKQARNHLCSGIDPTTVLLDLELPDGHGLDIVHDLPTGTPVIALSAEVSEETRLQCRRAGCAEVLSKGGKLENLTRIITDKENHQVLPLQNETQEAELSAQYNRYLAETRIELEQALDRKDYEQIRKVAHRLRGTAVHFGYGGISSGASAVGAAIASGRLERIETTLQALNEQLLDAAECRAVVQ